MLVSSPANVRYLTGFVGASAGVLVLPDRLVLFTDSRYRLEALRTVGAPYLGQDATDVASSRERDAVIQEALEPGATLAIESDAISLAEHAKVERALPGVKLLATEDVLLAQRLVKDAGEIARITAAAALSDAALQDLIAAEPLGWSERSISKFLHERLTDFGVSAPAFEIIATTGLRTALPHCVPSGQRLEEGECLLVDFGAEVEGYKADMTRTLWWGKASRRLEAVADAVREAYDAAVAMLEPGVEYPAVDHEVRRVFRGHGLESYVTHPAGHNIGLEIHERPFFGTHHIGVVAAGNVVTIEPGVYLPDVGGVRLENTILVTQEGPVPLTVSRQFGQIEGGRASQLEGSRTNAAPDTEGADLEAPDEHQRFLLEDRPSGQSIGQEGGVPPR